MRKIKLISTTIMVSLMAATLTAVSLSFSNSYFEGQTKIKKANENSNILNLNKDKNKFHSTTGSGKVSGTTQVKTELDNDVNFAYSNIIGGGTSTWHVVSGDDGYFYNSDPINGLKSITISFKTDSKSFKLYYSETSTFTEAKSSSFTSSTSLDTTFDFNSYKPNYFKFTNTSGSNLNISSIVLTYSCVSDFSIINVSSSDTSKGSVSESSGIYRNGTSITLTATPRTGYHFDGWYSGETLLSIDKSYTFDVASNLDIVAKFIINSYTLTVTSEDVSKGTVSGGGTYTYNSKVTLTASPNSGYEFAGWYEDEIKISSLNPYVFTATSDITLTAKFVSLLNVYNIYLESEDTSKGTASGPSTGIVGLDITVTAEGNTIFDYLDYWYDEDFNEVSYDSTYTFTMPEHDVYLTAAFVNDKTKIVYGEYPQSLVKDASLISALDAISVIDEKGYKTYNGDKYLKYYGVEYFDNDGETISAGEHYYKVERIEWKVLSTDSSSAFVTTKYLLDAQRYDESYSGTKSKTDYQGNTADVYANNYKYSELRTFLNTTFLNQAFDDTSKILTTEVDNSAATTYDSLNPFACENTSDKVFTLSYKDLYNTSYGFSSNDDRQCKTSEYACARGTYYSTSSPYLHNGLYWTRSPFSYDSYYAGGVGCGGTLDNYVSSSNVGVRPSLNISIA